MQNKILEEQQQLFGDDKLPTVTYANLQEMKYLENAIKEGLRMLPPVPAFGRQITEDAKWSLCFFAILIYFIVLIISR